MVAIAMLAGLLLIPGCRQPSGRERLRDESRARLFDQVREQQKIHARFQALGPGTPAAKVLVELGKPGSTTPCENAEVCWYYLISSRRYFVCFDKQQLVTCQGTLDSIPPAMRAEPKKAVSPN